MASELKRKGLERVMIAFRENRELVRRTGQQRGYTGRALRDESGHTTGRVGQALDRRAERRIRHHQGASNLKRHAFLSRWRIPSFSTCTLAGLFVFLAAIGRATPSHAPSAQSCARHELGTAALAKGPAA